MKRKIVGGLAFLIGLGAAGLMWAQSKMPPSQAAKHPSFEKMKSLVGVWKGTNAGKETTSAVYKLMSNGSALEETLTTPDSETMVTVYYVDGSRLMMTHFCATGTQPNLKNSNMLLILQRQLKLHC